ncbi:MAG: lysophospholipid acyltransferase family protein [Marinobacter sp.]|nr:lysophospholipid acyltransferase family protein [Marinobacter sp.]
MQTVRLISRLSLFGLSLMVIALVALVVGIAERLSRRPLDRTPWARLCFNGAARCLGFRIQQDGEVARGPVLFVSNHVSWADIPVLGGIAPLRFLSKAEVARWPVIGWLATQAGTLFIQRGSGRAGESCREISRALTQSQSVLVFPEGTTTVGLTVLPFHGRLLQSAIDSGVMIQPVTIGYRRAGQPDHLAPFVGDDDFQRHLLRLLRQPAVSVSVLFHEPVAVCPDTDLRQLCTSLQATVGDGLSRIHRPGSAAASSSSVASLT